MSEVSTEVGEPPSSSTEARMDEVCDRFEEGLKAGRNLRIEDYQGEVPEARRPALLRELLLLELAYRLRRGDRPTSDEYRLRFPEYAELVGAVFVEVTSWDAGRARRPTGETGPRIGPDEGLRTVTLDPSGTTARPPADGGPLSAKRRFHTLELHARGGLGEVFVARDLELHREVALKRIQDRHADDPGSRGRFLREAEITGQLEHPGIVPVYALGQDADGRPFYAMRLIRGDSLKDAIRRFHRAEGGDRDSGARILEFRNLIRRIVDVCNAIAYAHSRGVLHRDLKPANILLGDYGETLVVDWGLAKAIHRKGEEDGAADGVTPWPISTDGGSAPTQAGSRLGTPAYMSPEQAAGQIDRLGTASDVYSLGATLYSLLTGRPPFEDGECEATLQRVQRGEFPTPRRINPKVPPALEAVCLKAMSLEAADRYVSARALADDLEHWLADEPVSAWREPPTVRVVRWARRHKQAVTGLAAALAMALLAIGIAREVTRRRLSTLQSESQGLVLRGQAAFSSRRRPPRISPVGRGPHRG